MHRREAPSPALLASLCITVVAIACASIVLTRIAAGIASVWLANALVLGLMMRSPRTAAQWLLAAGAAGTLVANLLTGGTLAIAAGFAAINTFEVVLAFAGLHWLRVSHAPVPDERDFFIGVPVAILGAPALAAVVGATWWSSVGGGSWGSTFRDWWISDALGMLLLLPVVWSYSPSALRSLADGARAAEFWLWLSLVIAVSALAPLLLVRPFVVISLPLVIAAYRLGVFRTSLLALSSAVAVTTVALLVRNGMVPGGPADNLGVLSPGQLGMYSALSVLAPILVAIVVEHRELITRERERLHAQLRLITDNVPALIGYLDRDRRYRFVNGRYDEWYGLPQDAVIGRTAADIHGSALAGLLADRMTRALRGETVRFEVRLDSGRELESVYVPHVVDGEVDGFFVLANDVSERRAAERALFEEKDRAQITLDSIGDAVVACDNDMRLTLLNPVGELMTGWEEDEAIGRPVHDIIKLIDLVTGQPPLSPLRIALRENRAVALQLDCALERRDGLRSPIEDTASPIHGRDGNVVGAVMVFHDVSDSRAMAQKVSHLAQHDYLTDLPNRVLLQDRLSQALSVAESGAEGALLFVDLDLFKHINDSLGHQVGDQVLQAVAKRLVESVRDDDTVSRQGGDEFVLLLPRLSDPRDAARVAEKVIRLIEEPIELDGQSLYISASVGIALFPHDSRDLRTLMKQADTALFHAKTSGRARYSYFAQSMSEQADERMRLERDLRAAIAGNQLFLTYQPKVLLPERRIIGMEALVRWRMPSGELVPPGSFVPLAEEIGLIAAIDEWVMLEAALQAARWQAAGLPVVPVAVNVSLARLDADRLLSRVQSVLEQTGLPPACLEIEFTESQMFARHDVADALISDLKALGVRIAIDDFGTGYSSLNYLASYPFDTLKIDQSFVASLPSDGRQDLVVQMIISLGRTLGYSVIAEGVETEAQARILEAHGCREMQGYLFSEPVDAATFTAMLERGCLPGPSAAGADRADGAASRPAPAVGAT